jgi:hypothetical protein
MEGGDARINDCGCDCANWPKPGVWLGYRGLEILLQREGWLVNHKRVYRLGVEEKLSRRRKRGQKRSTVR